MLEVKNITMEFPGVKALNKVNLSFQEGKINALLGENGAGKSTLLKILSGVYQPTSGEIFMNGKPVNFQNTIDSRNAGIAIIHQELNLFSNLSICENIFLGQELKTKYGFLDQKEMDKICKVLLQQVGVQADPNTLLGDLKVSEQQLIEIAKALKSNASIILMDEPTSALSDKEIERLHSLIHSWKKEGKTIVYISHKMDELFQISDYFFVLRDGESVAAGPMGDTNEAQLVTLMVGREVVIQKKKILGPTNQPLFKVSNFLHKKNNKLLKNINFQIFKGEIVGLYGLMGAGRTELLECLFGMHPNETQMEVELLGEKVMISSTSDAIKHKMAFVTEDRKKEGLFMDQDLSFNISLPSLKSFNWLNERNEILNAERYRRELRIKSSNIHQACGKLSGGNQQKVIIAKWLSTNPNLLLLDEPTRGIDIQAKDEIYQLIQKMVAEGKSILFASSEIPEIIALADRVLVMSNGEIQATLAGEEINEHNLLKKALPKQ